MKVIFLDIDGVLNNVTEMIKYNEEKKDIHLIVPAMVERVNRIIDATDAKVVISSKWRYWFKIPELQKRLDVAGFTGEVIGTTPVFHKEPRGAEINFYLASHPEITHFVILDDQNDMHPLMEHLVQTNYFGYPDTEDGEGGLQDNHVEQAIKILNEKERL